MTNSVIHPWIENLINYPTSIKAIGEGEELLGEDNFIYFQQGNGLYRHPNKSDGKSKIIAFLPVQKYKQRNEEL